MDLLSVLGAKGKDRITGFEGVIVGRVVYISGCNQLLLAPVAKGGTFRESQWFDEQRVEILKGAPVRLDNSRTSGPDAPAPHR